MFSNKQFLSDKRSDMPTMKIFASNKVTSVAELNTIKNKLKELSLINNNKEQ